MVLCPSRQAVSLSSLLLCTPGKRTENHRACLGPEQTSTGQGEGPCGCTALRLAAPTEPRERGWGRRLTRHRGRKNRSSLAGRRALVRGSL